MNVARSLIRLFAAAALVAAGHSPSFGQSSSGGGFRPNPDEIVDRLDENKNGQVDPSEMEGRARFFLDGLARDNGLDLSKPIKTDKLRELLKARWGGGSSSGSGSSSRNTPTTSYPAAATPGVLAFGVASTGAPATVPGFGPPVGADSWDVLTQKYGKRVVQEVEEDLERYDKNKDGMLDAEELKNGRWRSDPLEYDKNKDGKLSKSELADREVGKSSSSGSSSSGSSGYGGSSYGYRPPGYGGGPPGSGGPPGYGGPGYGGSPPQSSSSGGTSRSSSSTGSSSSGGSSGGSSNSSSSSDAQDRAAKMADQILRIYDANKNGEIGKDEMGKVASAYHKADFDGNGTITKSELTKFALGTVAPSSSSGDKGSSSSGSSSQRASSSAAKAGGSSGGVKTYRFRTPAERLPEGLPEWFTKNDADADGQIVMSEFAKTWDEAKAKEFAQWDRNGDGVVTPAECLKK